MLRSLTDRFVDDWRYIARWSWSFRLAFFSTILWSGVAGLLMIWPGLDDWLPKWLFIWGGIGLQILFGLARLWKQPGTES